ncbi:30S ribosomal protein S6 [Spiroplasma corruscae]|uniref:Small ribosomal subunit protein bS6 n=1 Tax=Spiroplasma corruscae TaxID=216934 RepID=A0A222EMU4_9MOLU|nr:30S ribosomal protein S6 [Spiroplasma corruscae]ASP27795.1 30S ribosomal protein S6 [Spiroplasma corruscae]
MIRKYEIMYIIDKDVDDVKKVEQKFNEILTANSGKILESENWGLKDFAYEIDKKKKGHYCVLIVETDSTNISEFERVSHIDKNIVRSLIINTENEKNYIQSTMYAKTDMSKYREERKPNRPYEKRFRKDDNTSERKEPKEEVKATPSEVKEVKD